MRIGRLKKVESQNRRKESDLRGAIENEQEKDKENSDNKNKDKTSKKDTSEDYQLSRAFDLIMALNLIDNKVSQ